jgi:hypothetical protein
VIDPGTTPPADSGASPPTDPVLIRRAQWKRAATIGSRIGYLLYLVALIAFFVGFFAEFSSGQILVVEIGLIGGTIFLAPAMLLTYMVKAAVKDDADPGRQS